MKKLFTLLLFITSFHFSSLAQSQAALDSMERTLSSNAHDTIKLKTLGDLSWMYGFSNFEKSLQFGQQELALAEKLNDKASIALAYSDIGIAYTRMSKLDESLQAHLKSLAIRNELGLKEKAAGSYSNISLIYKQLGKYKESTDYMLRALKVYEEVKDEKKQALVLGNLSNLILNMDQLDLAASYIRKGIKLAEKTQSYQTLANLYTSYSSYFYKTKKYDSALVYNSYAIEVYTGLNNYTDLAGSLNSRGQIEIELKKYPIAMKSFAESLDIRKALGDELGIGTCHKNICFCLMKLKRFDEAMAHIDTSIEIFKRTESRNYLKEAYLFVMDIYQDKNDYKNAMLYYKYSEELEDSIINTETTNKMNELQVQYETEKKEQQIKIQSLELNRKNIFIGVIVAILALTIFIATLIYNRRKLKQDAKLQAEIIKQQDLASRGIIEAEENERKRIAGDLHDGVGQLFSAVKMNLSSISEQIKIDDQKVKTLYDKTIDMVDESCKEVRSISHNMMPNVLLKSGLSSAVREFISKIDADKIKINLETFGLNDRLDSNIETVLYRVIQESVNNVIKHADANQLDIQLSKDQEEITVTIEDNGKGFDTNNQDNFEGIGLKNIKTRVEFLKGTVEWDSTIDRGTVVSIHIPITA